MLPKNIETFQKRKSQSFITQQFKYYERPQKLITKNALFSLTLLVSF